jgi:3,4-dihydroxy 2-butanone 4-phosphate synthase/GTP cyclohydrolase II
MIAYTSEQLDYAPHIAMVHPDIDVNQPVVVRIHSECLTGDLFHSQRCDCGDQLDAAMKEIAKSKGIVIYLRQEGRGIGLINKLKAYNKQDEGLDTVEANLALGLDIDSRNYQNAIEILDDLKVKRIKLLTNNPDKLNAFDGTDIEVIERMSLEITANDNNRKYLKTKKDSLGHFLNI